MKYLFSFLFAFMLFTNENVQAQKLNFYKEDLNFFLDSNRFTVEGYYYFSNSDSVPVKQIIFYPFPKNDAYGIVDSVFVYDNGANKKLLVLSPKNHSGISFPLYIDGYGFTKIKIVYSQQLKGYSAEYILNTTLYWGKPLETANYKLFVKNNIKIDSLTYAPDSLKFMNNKAVYFWKKTKFLPIENFKIYFSF